VSKKKVGGDWLKALAGAGLTVRSAADALQTKGWLDTGNYALNWAISGRFVSGGYPLGHTVEIFGDPATGKSFLVSRALASVQKLGGVALLDDTEAAYGIEHATRLGVDMTRLAYTRSRTVKEHLNATKAFIKAYHDLGLTSPAVIAVDSIAQLSTDHELEVQLDRRDMSKAAELKGFFRIIGGDLFDIPAVHIGTNHTIAAIGSMFQSRTTPGGGGPKFAATVRLDLRAISKIKAGADYSGVICTVFVDKNRIAPPWKRIQLAIPFAQPISRASGIVPVLLDLGVLEEQGQSLVLNGEKVGRANKSKDKFLERDAVGEQLLETYPDLLATVDAQLADGTLTARPSVEEIVE